MRYIHFYGTASEHDAVYNGEGYEEPWVALTGETGLVTFNRLPFFDDAIYDLMRYDQGKTVVLDIDGLIANRTIFVTNSGQSAQDIVTNGSISWDMLVSYSYLQEDLTIPADAGLILVTNHSDYAFDDETISDFDGEFSAGQSRTINRTALLEEMGAGEYYGTKTTVYYIYDLAARVKHTLTIVDLKESNDDDEPSVLQILWNGHVPVVQRAIDGKGVDVIDVDTLQHAAQLSDSMFMAANYLNTPSIEKYIPPVSQGGGTSSSPSEQEEEVAGPSENLPVLDADEEGVSGRDSLVFASTLASDYVECTAVESDTDNNVQTVSIVTKHLFDNRNVSLSLNNQFDVQMGSWTYKVEVDGVEVCSTTFNKQYSDTRISINDIWYSAADDEWACQITALGV